jgi:hypothetical protein
MIVFISGEFRKNLASLSRLFAGSTNQQTEQFVQNAVRPSPPDMQQQWRFATGPVLPLG